MIHPLFKVLASRPELLAAHLGGYVDLVAAQGAQALAATRQRAVLAVLMAIGLLVGLLLAGVAALLAAALPGPAMPAAWALWVVPAVPLLGAAACGLALSRRPSAWSLDTLRQQAAAELALLRAVGDA